MADDRRDETVGHDLLLCDCAECREVTAAWSREPYTCPHCGAQVTNADRREWDEAERGGVSEVRGCRLCAGPSDAVQTIMAGAAACRAEARLQGWDGQGAHELTALDCQSIADDVVRVVGRRPTRAEWIAAGYAYVGSEHYEG